MEHWQQTTDAAEGIKSANLTISCGELEAADYEFVLEPTDTWSIFSRSMGHPVVVGGRMLAGLSVEEAVFILADVLQLSITTIPGPFAVTMNRLPEKDWQITTGSNRRRNTMPLSG